MGVVTRTGDSSFQLLVLLLLWGQRLALRGDASALMHKLANPTAQGRLANAAISSRKLL